MHLDESVHPCCFIFTQAATYPPACFSLRVANYSEWWYQMLKYSNSCVSLKVESCDSPVLIRRQCWTVPSTLRVCHYLSLPNSPLFPLHGYLCRDKPCCIVVGHDSCKTGAKRQLFTGSNIVKSTSWQACIRNLWIKMPLQVCWDGLWCNRIIEYILCSIPLHGTMAGWHSPRGRAGGCLEVAQHQVQKL